MLNVHTSLSRRERQIMDILYRRGRATAAGVMDGSPEPSYRPCGRTAILEGKEHVKHEEEDCATSIPPRCKTRGSKVGAAPPGDTFFDSSTEKSSARCSGREKPANRAGSRIADREGTDGSK